MTLNSEERKILVEAAAGDGRYPVPALIFVTELVSYTVDKCKRAGMKGQARHVTGAELLNCALDLALERYKFMAPSIFEYWGFYNGRDIGNTVFNLIRAGLLSATPDDRLEDFDGMTGLPEILRKRLNQ